MRNQTRAKLLLAALAVLPIAQVASAQPELPPMTQANYWQAFVTAGSYGNYPTYPTGTVTGYKFIVNRQANSTLPMVFGNPAYNIMEQQAPLYRKINATQYTIWYPTVGLGYLGLLLTPGEYVLPTRPTTPENPWEPSWNPTEHSAQVLANGQMITPEDQQKFWQVPSYENTYVTVPTTANRNVKGFKFTISANASGAVPAVTNNYLTGSSTNRYGNILKRVNATQYSYYGSGYGFGKGLILRPGDYVVEFEAAEAPLTVQHYRFAKVLQGYWLQP